MKEEKERMKGIEREEGGRKASGVSVMSGSLSLRVSANEATKLELCR